MKKERLNQFEILRFIAAMIILVQHTNILPPMTENGVSTDVIRSGYLYVNFFFVLAGFLLAYNYKGKTIDSFKKYFVPKAIRIYMLLFVCLLLSLVTLPFHLPSFLLILSGTYTWIPGVLQYVLPHNLAPTWFLSVYILFVLLFPFIKKFFDKNLGYSILATMVIFLGSSIAVLFAYDIFEVSRDLPIYDTVRYTPYLHLGSFLLGVSCGYLYFYFKPSALYGYISVLLLGVYTYLITFKDYPLDQRSAILFAILILFFALDRSFISRFFSNRVFVYLGSLSFSIYLLHMAVFNIFGDAAETYYLLYVTTVLIVSAVVNELFEKRLSNKIIKKFNEVSKWKKQSLY